MDILGDLPLESGRFSLGKIRIQFHGAIGFQELQKSTGEFRDYQLVCAKIQTMAFILKLITIENNYVDYFHSENSILNFALYGAYFIKIDLWQFSCIYH